MYNLVQISNLIGVVDDEQLSYASRHTGFCFPFGDENTVVRTVNQDQGLPVVDILKLRPIPKSVRGKNTGSGDENQQQTCPPDLAAVGVSSHIYSAKIESRVFSTSSASNGL